MDCPSCQKEIDRITGLCFRRDWLGISAGFLVLTVLLLSPSVGRDHPIHIVFVVIVIACFIVSVARFGPVALMSTLLFFHLAIFFPITTDLTAWYAGTFVLDLIFLLAVAISGFYISLAGQPLFRGQILQEE